MRRAPIPAVVLLGVLAAAARAQDGPEVVREVRFDQRLGEQVPLDLPFRDETGKTVPLGDYFHGKPVILVLAYYRCPMLCSQVLDGLLECTRRMSFRVGREYQVVTVSFDPHEPFGLAAAKKVRVSQEYGRPGVAEGWHFLTGDAPQIERLTQAVGFRYFYNPKIDQYAHASGIMLLTPGGRVARYIFGISYLPRPMELGLVEASGGKIGSPVHQLILLCYAYDHIEGRYSLRIMSLVRLGGVLTVLILGGALVWAWRRELRVGRQTLPTG